MNEKTLKLYYACKRWVDLRHDLMMMDDRSFVPAIARVEREIEYIVNDVTRWLDERAHAVEPQLN